MVEHKRLSNSGLFDLWEHACLLYHNFEWQSAADTFSQLARLSPDPVDQKTFALNRGLIEARLGDFDLASASFEKALLLDANDPVAHFLLGVVRVEVEDHYTGYAHLKRALEGLHAEVLDCRTRGLHFGLARSAVEEDAGRVRVILKAGKDQAGKAKVTPICLHSIPTELIFEAPPRPGSTLQEGTTTGNRHTSSTDSRSDARFTREPKTPAPITPDGKSHPVISTAPTADIEIETMEIGFDHQLPNPSPLRSLPRKRLLPRDAQIREGSTKELARFLRHAGPSGAANITVDRLYLQRLMQGYNGFPTASQVYDQAHASSDAVGLATSSIPPHDGIESLLDLYIGYRPERGLSPDDGAHASAPKSVARKPLPGAAVSPLSTADRTEDPTQSCPEATHSLEIPLIKRRRPTLESAQLWLRKEVNTPWTRTLTKGERLRPGMASSPSSAGSATSSDNHSNNPVPSIVPSTEIFRFGMSGRK